MLVAGNKPLERNALLTEIGVELMKRGLTVADSQHFVTDVVESLQSFMIGHVDLDLPVCLSLQFNKRERCIGNWFWESEFRRISSFN